MLGLIVLASAILGDPLCTYVKLSCRESVYTFSTPSGIGQTLLLAG